MPRRKPFEVGEVYIIENSCRAGQYLCRDPKDHQKLKQTFAIRKRKYRTFCVLSCDVGAGGFSLVVRISK